MISNNKISNLITSQVPFFVRNDHENFVSFVEAYYEFLEQQTGVINVSRSLLDQADVDQTDLFANNFYNNFLSLIPKDTQADKNLLIKNIKDFYRSRGTEKSIRFLMRVLFNEETQFYYPQKDVLKVSDGKWFVEKSIKIGNVVIDGQANNDIVAIDNFVGRKITGAQSNASALVEKVVTYYDTGSLVRELKISNQYRDFVSGEQISATFNENGVEKSITANLFSGSINTVEIINGGSRYNVGDVVAIQSNTGNGALIEVSEVARGGLFGVSVLNGGAGFQVGDRVAITGGGGSGANANVISVIDNGSFHPNSYNINSSTIELEQNTAIGNARYSNLISSIVDPANNWIKNSYSYFVYANTGPISEVLIFSLGSNYTTTPTISASANTRVRNLGILGKMRINNGGEGYLIGDTITFENVVGGRGTGALAQVSNVDTSQGNAISEVRFVEMPGHIIGGSGYDQFFLPTAHVNSSNASAYGANISVTAVLGFGESLVSTGSVEGRILSLRIVSGGTGYETVPTLNLQSIGDGTAQAVATIITGSFTYPGRYLNDDGHVSSYNFIQDRDYYQKFSYVVKLRQSLDKYKKVLKTLIHPAGMKLFGEYTLVDNGQTLNVNFREVKSNIILTKEATYSHNIGNVTITYTSHNQMENNVVYLDWVTGNLATSNANVEGPYEIKTVVNTDNFIIFSNDYISNTALPNTSGSVNVGIIIY